MFLSRNGSVVAYFHLDFDKNSAVTGEDITDIFNTSLSGNNSFGLAVDTESIQVTQIQGNLITCRYNKKKEENNPVSRVSDIIMKFCIKGNH